MKVARANSRLTHYFVLFKEHVLLKLEVLAWRQKTSMREARWNELNAKLNDLLEVAPLPSLVDESSYC
jgi:hypothetical protein